MNPNEGWQKIVEGAKQVLSHFPLGDDEADRTTQRILEDGAALAQAVAQLCEWLNAGGHPPDVLVPPQVPRGPLTGVAVIERLRPLLDALRADPDAKLAALVYLTEQTARKAGYNVAQTADLLYGAWARGDRLGQGGS